LLKFDGAALVIVEFAVGQGQPPHRQNAVDVIPHPGIGVVAVDVDRRTGGKQTTNRMLPGQNDSGDMVIEMVELGLEVRSRHRIRAKF
jgi:hypothetical protein